MIYIALFYFVDTKDSKASNRSDTLENAIYESTLLSTATKVCTKII